MNQFYFGQSLEYITAEYAKSGRSSCKACKDKIDKDSLRMGLCLDDDHFSASYWYHLKCFTLKPRHKELSKQKQIFHKVYGIDDLEPNDFDLVVQHLKAQLKRITEGKKAPQKKTKSMASKTSKSKESEDIKSQSEVDNKKKKKASLSKKSKIQQIKAQKKAGKSLKKSEKKKEQKKKTFFTKAQDAEYKQLVADYMKLSVDQLKSILEHNRQTKTGTKTELSIKCADGRQMGRIPACGTCFGGKLRFDRQTATYKCPGFMQDDTFKHCGAKFCFDDIKRQPWTQP